MIFVDTSAVVALIVPSDEAHAAAVRTFDALARQKAALITSSYVLSEMYALVGRRLGLAAVEAIREDLEPLFEIVWIDESVHGRGIDLLLARRWSRLSLVDATSFIVMDDARVDSAWAYDAHFARAGFSLA